MGGTREGRHSAAAKSRSLSIPMRLAGALRNQWATDHPALLCGHPVIEFTRAGWESLWPVTQECRGGPYVRNAAKAEAMSR